MGYYNRKIKSRKSVVAVDILPIGPELTDAAAELINVNQLDAQQITGTGANGRITKADVLRYIGEQQSNTGEEE